MKKNQILIFIISIIISCQAFAHPGGNMIVVGKYVLWSYVSPIEDTEHHASVMIWSPNSKPTILLKSEFAASDYMFSSNGEHIYIVEQRYLQNTDKHEFRILKTRIGEEPKEIWSWFEDEWRIGNGGFFMNSDQEIVFGKYPNIYSLRKGQTPNKYFEFNYPINRIRAINNTQILLFNKSNCWLTNHDGNIIKEWTNLIDLKIDDAPLNRNQIFDADFKDGELILAYWGKRTFISLLGNGSKKTIMQVNKPFVPHWVAFYGNEKLLFSSKMLFNGETPKPKLILYKSYDEIINIWDY